MGEFFAAIAAGIAVSLWNKFLLNGGWRACLIEEHFQETEADDSTTSSTISDVYTH